MMVFIRIVWILFLVGAVYICEEYMFIYGTTIRLMKMDVLLLTEKMDILKINISMGLNSLRREFKQELSNLLPKLCEEVHDDLSCKLFRKINNTVKKIVTDEIQLYDADKTGLPDFALETSGGSILSTRNTENFLEPPVIFGIAVGKNSHSARCIIQACVLPGECWAFRGSTGAVVIQLIGMVYIKGVSLEHIPAILSPTGDISSAPNNVSIWGLNCIEDEGFYLGHFTYNKNGSRIQHFKIQGKVIQAFQLIEVKIHSNHGDPRYTCIYRVRVHGKLKCS